MIDILNFLEDATDVLRPAGRHGAVPAATWRWSAGPGGTTGSPCAARRWNQLAVTPVFLRDRAQVARWFTGLDLVAPGLVEVHQWRPEPRGPGLPRGQWPCWGRVALLA